MLRARARASKARPGLTFAARPRGCYNFRLAMSGRGVEHNNGINELMVAASRGDLGRVESLLRDGADPNARDAFGQTALMYAAGAGHQAVSEELIDAGADVDARNRNNKTASDLAASRGHAEAAAFLRGARLFLAAREGD